MFYAKISSIPDKENKDAVLLNSGGIDSRVIAKMAKDRGFKLHSIFIDTNPEISKVSIKAAAETAKLYCEDHEVYEWPVDWRVKKTPGHLTIPFSGLTAQLIGAQYAVYKGLSLVFVGDKQVERKTAHFDWLDKILAFSYHTDPVSFVAPIWNDNFDAVIKLAEENDVNLTTTYSCASNPPCGKCFSCINRARYKL